MEMSVNIAGIKLEHPLMNAAGTCRQIEDVERLVRSASSAVVVGSITVESRGGNSGSVYWAGPTYSLNSLGLPNRGAAYYRKMIPQMVAIAHDSGKPLFVSVAGFMPEEYAYLAELALNAGADLIELNLGCPNVWEGNKQKHIPCFNVDLLANILRVVGVSVGSEAPVSVKVSPFSDPSALKQAGTLIASFTWLRAVTAVNTFPNALSYDGMGKSRITPGGGLAGLAGPAMKPVGLGQVRQLRALLPERVQLIGVGGITRGRDMLEYLYAGASAVQVATAYLDRHEHVFGTLLEEYVEVADRG